MGRNPDGRREDQGPVSLVKRADVIYLITRQRDALLASAEREAPHHAGVLRDMAGWWEDLAKAVGKLTDPTAIPAVCCGRHLHVKDGFCANCPTPGHM